MDGDAPARKCFKTIVILHFSNSYTSQTELVIRCAVNKRDKFQSTFTTLSLCNPRRITEGGDCLPPATLFYSIALLQFSHYTAHFLHPCGASRPKTRGRERPGKIDFQHRSDCTCTGRLGSGQSVRYCGLASRLCFLSRVSREVSVIAYLAALGQS